MYEASRQLRSLARRRRKDKMANAENHGLLEMFAVECHGHLDALRASLAAVRAARSADASDVARDLADTLHTLAGAARAVDLLDLEYLWRAVEDLLAAGPLHEDKLLLIDAAIELAPQLLAPPAGRVRNQMMTLVSRGRAAAGALS